MLFAGSENVNPIIPPFWEAMAPIGGLACAAMVIAALISIARSKNHTSVGVILWVLVVFALPVLGPILWFYNGRSSAPTRRSIPS